MNEASWKRLLHQIRDGYVIPVIGTELLVDASGDSLQGNVALALLQAHGWEREAELPPFHELNAAVALLKSQTCLQDLYSDIDGALLEVTAGEAAIPAATRQLAAIAHFRLFVTLTPDDLLACGLRRRRAVSEIVHPPSCPAARAATWARTGAGGRARCRCCTCSARPGRRPCSPSTTKMSWSTPTI